MGIEFEICGNEGLGWSSSFSWECKAKNEKEDDIGYISEHFNQI